jgi:predicted phosphate transport protein (TIGR00153 family)
MVALRPGPEIATGRGSSEEFDHLRDGSRTVVLRPRQRTIRGGRMFGRFLPKETSFFDFFEQHAALTVEGTREFMSLVSTGANIPSKARRISDIEHETDVITHRCVEALHKTFITPIDRDEIHRLITRMDDIMDFVEAASERIELYEITTMTPDARDLADVLHRAAVQVEIATKGLRNLKHPQELLKVCKEVTRLENEADSILRRAVARLFREEKDPITVIKWKEIYESLENASDRCEDVANIIEGVVIEHS